MAGVGETCSQVASLLWAVVVHMRESMTVTQKKAYWVLPPSVKEVPYAAVSRINFVGPAGSLAALQSPYPVSSPSLITPPPITSPPSRLTSLPPSSAGSNVPSPSFEEVSQLFASLAECSSKPAILALVKDY